MLEAAVRKVFEAGIGDYVRQMIVKVGTISDPYPSYRTQGLVMKAWRVSVARVGMVGARPKPEQNETALKNNKKISPFR